MSKALAVLQELKECASYWSEYDVPICIHARIDEAIAELLAQPEQEPNQDIANDIDYLITAFENGADADDYWRPISDLRDDLVTLKGQVPVRQILEAFPLLDEEGLDEEKHHCEWTLQQDRKRLHAMLAQHEQTKQEPKIEFKGLRLNGDSYSNRKPLSDNEIFNAWPPSKKSPCVHSFKAGVKFAEKAHGIGVDDE